MLRLLVGVLVLVLVLVPLVGVATDDLAAGGPHHGKALRHAPARGWRTVPVTIDRAADAPRTTEIGRLVSLEPAAPRPPLARPPFVPPRA